MKQLVEKKIAEAGHRASVRKLSPDKLERPFRLDVGRDRSGEFFIVDVREDVEASVLDVDGDHVLLMFREFLGKSDERDKRGEEDKFKSLIGHDERQLFVAAIPENTPVSTVFQAKEALKPEEVRAVEKGAGTKTKHKHKRKTLARLRQGDFFFIPAGAMLISDKAVIHKNEPISRGRGTSHICSELIRLGGENRYFYATPDILRKFPLGLSEKDRAKYVSENPKAKRWRWEVRRGGNIKVWARGTVRHPEHATLVLDIWHEVVPNTEAQSKTAQHLAFVD